MPCGSTLNAAENGSGGGPARSSGSLQAGGAPVANSLAKLKALEILHCWNFRRNYQALFKPDPGIPVCTNMDYLARSMPIDDEG